MQWYEVRAALKYSYYRTKDNWEQARLVSYLIAQVNSKKKLKYQDICEFPWEKENTDEDTKISKEDIERLNKLAEDYLSKTNTH